jgi:hypothetical protein
VQSKVAEFQAAIANGEQMNLFDMQQEIILSQRGDENANH